MTPEERDRLRLVEVLARGRLMSGLAYELLRPCWMVRVWRRFRSAV